MITIKKKTLNIILLAFLAIVSSCKGKEISKLYVDTDYRPSYHFTPQANWMNDPNGMVYYKGEYHLFYQYYPEGNVWGPMHWGHAISTDLVNWEHLPIALYPDDLGYIFSGSAVIDKENTSGLKTGEEGVMVAIFTHHNVEKEHAGTHNHQYQSIAYSNDKGRTWVKYKNNPVLPNDEKLWDFRDPKVIWHEDTKRWVMILAAGQNVRIYTSPNLIDWTFASVFGADVGAHGGVWECPDLLPMKIDGVDKEKWVMIVSINPGGPNGGSGTQYFVGDFDGKTFTSLQKETKWLDYGTDNYAGVTWSNAPSKKPLFLGWMSNWHYATEVPTTTWRSAMTVTRELSLIQEQDSNFLLCNKPIDLLDSMSGNPIFSLEKASKGFSVNGKDELSNGRFVAKANIKLSEGDVFTLKYGNDSACIAFEYNKTTGIITLDRSKSGYAFKSLNENIAKAEYHSLQDMHFEIWVDRSSMEIFIDNGKCVFTQLFFPKRAFDKLDLNITGKGQIISFDVINMS